MFLGQGETVPDDTLLVHWVRPVTLSSLSKPSSPKNFLKEGPFFTPCQVPGHGELGTEEGQTPVQYLQSTHRTPSEDSGYSTVPLSVVRLLRFTFEPDTGPGLTVVPQQFG